MSTRHVTTSHTVVLKGLRVFSVQYFCDGCDNQWIDEMLTVGNSWCPCCDQECQPDGIEEYEVETDEEDAEPDPREREWEERHHWTNDYDRSEP